MCGKLLVISLLISVAYAGIYKEDKCYHGDEKITDMLPAMIYYEDKSLIFKHPIFPNGIATIHEDVLTAPLMLLQANFQKACEGISEEDLQMLMDDYNTLREIVKISRTAPVRTDDWNFAVPLPPKCPRENVTLLRRDRALCGYWLHGYLYDVKVNTTQVPVKQIIRTVAEDVRKLEVEPVPEVEELQLAQAGEVKPVEVLEVIVHPAVETEVPEPIPMPEHRMEDPEIVIEKVIASTEVMPTILISTITTPVLDYMSPTPPLPKVLPPMRKVSVDKHLIKPHPVLRSSATDQKVTLVVTKKVLLQPSRKMTRTKTVTSTMP